jgi:transcription elongation factor GreA
MATEYLSKEKHDALQAELRNLKTVDRKEVAEQLEEAKALGDLSENAEYHEARDRQADIEARITQIEEILRSAVIVDQHHSVVVEVGSTLTIKKAGGDKVEYTVVGSEEADIASNKISHQSPLGAALLGHKKNDEVKVTTPKGEVTYSILDIK